MVNGGTANGGRRRAWVDYGAMALIASIAIAGAGFAFDGSSRGIRNESTLETHLEEHRAELMAIRTDVRELRGQVRELELEAARRGTRFQSPEE